MHISTLKKYSVGPDAPVHCSVGGALCLEMVPEDTSEETRELLRFPGPGLLAEFLALANTRCGESLLWDYAKDIYDFYEEKKIDEAWEAMEKALSSDV